MNLTSKIHPGIWLRPSVRALATAVLVAIFVGALPMAEAAQTWEPRQFNAKGDGVTLDTEAFTSAISAANHAGGGIVRVTKGVYLIGTIDLLSNVTLQIDKDARLLGSPRIADYRRGNWPALIKAKGQSHIAIVGEGTIDGQGALVATDTLRIIKSGNYLDFFPELNSRNGLQTASRMSFDPVALQRAGKLGERVFSYVAEGQITRASEFVRPQILEFWHCSDIVIRGVTLTNAACWVETYRDCENLSIDRLTVRSTSYWNNDGIDIVDSQHVTISNSDIDAADDGICLKSETGDHGCQDIRIFHCKIRSSASALKLGTGSIGGFRKIRVDDLDIHDTFRSAVALESVDGGDLKDIEIRNVRARHTGNAFFIRLGNRLKDHPPGIVTDVVLSDFYVEVAGDKPDAGYSYSGPPTMERTNIMPSSIVGLPDAPIGRVVLRHIKIVSPGGATGPRGQVKATDLSSIPEKRDRYPEFSMFGELPSWGLYVRHVSSLQMEDVTLVVAKSDYRPATLFDGVTGLQVDGVTIDSPDHQPPIVLFHTPSPKIYRISLPQGQPEAIRKI